MPAWYESMDILIDTTYGEERLDAIPIEALSEFVLEQENKPANTEVSISFVDDEEMARMNGEYRGKTGPTDVLSFECDGLDDGFGMPNDLDGVFELGDIIIATDVAQRQKALYGTTFEQEITVLLIHGLLHLCGYDHIEDDEAEVMEAREDELLSLWEARS